MTCEAADKRPLAAQDLRQQHRHLLPGRFARGNFAQQRLGVVRATILEQCARFGE